MPQYKPREETIRAITVDAILANNTHVPPSHSARIAGLLAAGRASEIIAACNP